MKVSKQCCGAGAEEAKVNFLLDPEPKLRIAVPAPFYLSKTRRNFVDKNHGCFGSNIHA